ncbi:MAG: hypothetical protein Sylvanvirus10_12 [Sylvanvirus sp.]|uniref:Uncharacterized protein n=1 Tax=Sylvanvirus sp. TaxID=2487774 RepID=A0A3G5AHX3_9VIRU|nr:MAG: hypothetical protein Sylvanvirus10_12 [Sylvanvirus sp.]
MFLEDADELNEDEKRQWLLDTRTGFESPSFIAHIKNESKLRN